MGGVDRRSLVWAGDCADATTDEDLQIALWLTYEQHYRGLAGVDDGWEWHPDLLWARSRWENQFLAGLRHHAPVTLECDDDAATTVVVATLGALASADEERSLSKFLMREANSTQFTEFLVHRSLYHLEEADPHTWGIPRLSGSIKEAMVTIQADEYGGGATAMMHAQLFSAAHAGLGSARPLWSLSRPGARSDPDGHERDLDVRSPPTVARRFGRSPGHVRDDLVGAQRPLRARPSPARRRRGGRIVLRRACRRRLCP